MCLSQQQNVLLNLTESLMNPLYLHTITHSLIFKIWHSLWKSQHNNKLVEFKKITYSLDILQQTCEV